MFSHQDFDQIRSLLTSLALSIYVHCKESKYFYHGYMILQDTQISTLAVTFSLAMNVLWNKPMMQSTFSLYFENRSNLTFAFEMIKQVCVCVCVHPQVAAQLALWFWTGRVTSCTRPTWETQASSWCGEGRWSTARTSSSTTSTHPSSCPSLPRAPRGPSSVTGETPTCCPHIHVSWFAQ